MTFLSTAQIGKFFLHYNLFCFYRLNYLACKRNKKFILFLNETHFGIM